MAISKEQIIEKMQQQAIQREHIIGVAVGAGISAKYAVKGGASSIERFAAEVGIKQQTEAFKNILR
ncbi:hypothetical protein [Paenibacillus agilis]|uniref:hypothetical protein n=1 Tax=Paenibacillus agilis TaxID=3020863 RepID=UPI001649FF2E|nr:hypothetical protein [Paenibacillus agilis]